ncbi:hypothetical protein RRG08_006101 [Elysia crispata]|uniref:Uncharacterized protein n=1 Tax=Elysia crispata TaxID=231223 RepID=A0AAE1ABM3_9GAST|nr:hypothetical protein RRG08_006101 [Elysia crispata]
MIVEVSRGPERNLNTTDKECQVCSIVCFLLQTDLKHNGSVCACVCLRLNRTFRPTYLMEFDDTQPPLSRRSAQNNRLGQISS